MDKKVIYDICPECGSIMDVDEEYMAEHYGEGFYTGVIRDKDTLFWCNHCEQAYLGLEAI